MFCTIDVRIAGDVAADVARDQPRIDVVAAAGAVADDQGDLLALVEIGDAVGGGAVDRASRDRRNAGEAHPAR